MSFLGPFDRLSKDALAGSEDKVVPVTMVIDGEKQVIGLATFRVSDNGLQIDGEITDPRLADFLKKSSSFSINDAPKFEKE